MNLEINTESLLIELRESHEVADGVAKGFATIDTLTQVAAISVRGYFADRQSNKDAQTLSEWRAYVETRCSERYFEMQQNMPAATRAELNDTEELLLLNGLRRGIKQVMSERYLSIQSSHRRSVPRPKSVMASVQF